MEFKLEKTVTLKDPTKCDDCDFREKVPYHDYVFCGARKSDEERLISARFYKMGSSMEILKGDGLKGRPVWCPLQECDNFNDQ